ncbi:helix-turn-helix domain-containing protein [Lentibacillus salinarum]|uniref:Helix-turn-helix domain-containing protein n=1 Tax=Lentibacillus salinarum TaxID=446820 RepID=A0ABW3ZSR1_9BACI
MKDAELEKLIEGIRSITTSLDLDELLTKIVTNTRTVISGGDACYLQLYDPETGLLVPKASSGLKKNIQFFKTKIGESVTGKTYQDGTARIYHSIEEIYKNMDNISDNNFYYLHAALIGNNMPNALMCAPVSIGEKHIGVMTIHVYKQRKLTNRDLHLLEVFAGQAAIAIQNAQLYTEVTKSLKEVTGLSVQLKEKNELLLKGNQIHDTLTRLSLQNEGTESIVTALDGMMTSSTSFINFLEGEFYPKRSGQSSAFSMEEISKFFSDRQEPLFVTSYGQNYYLYPLVNRTVFLGCLIVTLTEAPFTRMDQIAIEQGGTALTLELVKKHTLAEVYYKKTHEYFNELLQNHDSDTLFARGREYGLDMSQFLFVSLFEISQSRDLQQQESDIHRLVTKIKKALQRYDILIYGFYNKATLLVSISSPSEVIKISESIRSIVARWQTNEYSQLHAGAGNPYRGIENIAVSHDEANKALSYLSSQKYVNFIQYNEIGVNRLFLNQSKKEIAAFLNETLGPLQLNTGKTKDLEKTLDTYIACNKSATQAAEKLHIHINTLYQRLKKIEQLLNLNLNDPKDFLQIQLACHLKENF